MQGLEKFTSHLLFLRKLLKDVLHGGVNQDTGRCGIQEAGNPTQKRGEGILRWRGEEDSRTPAAEGNKFSLKMPQLARKDFFQDDEMDRKLDVNDRPEKASDNWQRVWGKKKKKKKRVINAQKTQQMKNS